MYSLINQELARQHQATLMQDATRERLSKHVYKQTPIQPVNSQQKSLSESDFAAIRRDLRSTLSEWYLEPGTQNIETVIDTFMRRLKMRLSHNAKQHSVGLKH